MKSTTLSRDNRPLYLYLLGLSLMAVGLPLSRFLMSVSQFVLAGNWLLEGNYKEKLNRFWGNKAAVLFASIFLLHILGVLYSTDISFALKDIRIKLPVLLLPFFIASAPPLTRKQFDWVMRLFTAAVFIGTMVSMTYILGYFEIRKGDYRNVSIFVSHIRFSLMICVSIFYLLYSLLFHPSKSAIRILQVALLLWLVIFLFLLKAMAGVVALVACLIASMIYFIFRSERKIWRYAFGSLSLLILAGSAAFIYYNVHQFYNTHGIDLNHLDQYTKNGEQYQHRKEIGLLENGNYVWLYLAWDEVEKSWNARSSLDFKGKDNKGNDLYATLIRFLSSKGYRKDAEGVNKLTDAEVEAIENGIPNVRYMDGMSFNDRIYQIIWEIHIYSIGLNPQGHSVAQRLDFWKTALQIIKEHPYTGVGTGDTKNVIASEYEKMHSRLSEKYRERPHNQYLTMLVAFGIPGFLWFMFAFTYPLLLRRNWKNYHYLTFIIIALISMLSEDTLETQAGVSFVAFFNCLFLFGKDE